MSQTSDVGAMDAVTYALFRRLEGEEGAARLREAWDRYRAANAELVGHAPTACLVAFAAGFYEGRESR